MVRTICFVDGDEGGGALTEGAPAVIRKDASWLADVADRILRDCAVIGRDEIFDTRTDYNALYRAMARAQAEAHPGDAHSVDQGEDAAQSAESEYLLAACAAYELVFSCNEVFKNNPPERYRITDGTAASLFQKGSLQDCALRLAEEVLLPEVELAPEIYNSSDFPIKPVRKFRKLLLSVPGQSESTITAIAPLLEKQLRLLAGKQSRRARAFAKVRHRIRRRPLRTTIACLVAGALAATGVAIWSWPSAPTVTGSAEAMTTKPVLSNILEQVTASVVGDSLEVGVNPWSSPPGQPLTLKVDDPEKSQMEVTVRLRMQEPDGRRPGIDLGAQLPPGTVFADAQTTVQNAANRVPKSVPELLRPKDVISLSLDDDGTETVVRMMVSISSNDNPRASATVAPMTLRCGYNPAPVSILLSPAGNQDPEKFLVTVVPMYVLKSC